MNTPVTAENLELKAYLEHPPNAVLRPHVRRFFQRCFYTLSPKSVSPTRVKGYFINFELSEHPLDGSDVWASDAQFTLYGGQTVNVNMLPGNWSIEQIEEFFQRFFYAHNCLPYGE